MQLEVCVCPSAAVEPGGTCRVHIEPLKLKASSLVGDQQVAPRETQSLLLAVQITVQLERPRREENVFWLNFSFHQSADDWGLCE